jgi:hypothetical protein
MGLGVSSVSGCIRYMHLHFYEAKQPSLKLKTRLKQLLGNHPLDVALTDQAYFASMQLMTKKSFRTLGSYSQYFIFSKLKHWPKEPWVLHYNII